jgi:hypothetical protein
MRDTMQVANISPSTLDNPSPGGAVVISLEDRRSPYIAPAQGLAVRKAFRAWGLTLTAGADFLRLPPGTAWAALHGLAPVDADARKWIRLLIIAPPPATPKQMTSHRRPRQRSDAQLRFRF